MSGLQSDREFRFILNKEKSGLGEETKKFRLNTGTRSAPMSLPETRRSEAVAAFDSETNDAITQFLKNAELLAQNGEFELAANLYKAVLRRVPGSVEAQNGLAACTGQAGVDDGFAGKYNSAEREYAAGNFASAKSLYLEALKEPHFEGEALFTIYKNLGNIDLQSGDLDGAEENYNRAFTLQPDSDVLLVNFGSLAIHKKDLERAVRCFRQAVEISPSNTKAWIGLGVIHREFGDSELAWANIERALDLEKGNSTAAKLVADWALKDNEIETAIRLLGNYLAAQPQDAFMHLMQAKFMYLLGRLNPALVHAKTALSLDAHIDEGETIFAVISEEIAAQVSRLK